MIHIAKVYHNSLSARSAFLKEVERLRSLTKNIDEFVDIREKSFTIIYPNRITLQFFHDVNALRARTFNYVIVDELVSDKEYAICVSRTRRVATEDDSLKDNVVKLEEGND